MPLVTLQLGQCGNQLGQALFDTLAKELGGQGYAGSSAADTFFVQQQQQRANNSARDGSSTSSRMAARAVLVDMEPKVIFTAKQSALSSSHGWCYAPACSASGQSGSGNNWALGHNRFGPALTPAVLELVRKQVEACDTFEGFLMLQSMAGGTGAGAGTHLAEALVDEYSSAHVLNCCVWPFESGEVTVQPFNTLLSMSTLVELSSGILLLQNEALHATCSRQLGIKQPTFKDLNAVAARSLASALLPCYPCPATNQPSTLAQSPSFFSRSTSSRPTSASVTTGHTRPPTAASATPGATTNSLPISPVADLMCHIFSHPSYRVASLRTLPQVPVGSMDFTTFSWKPLLARLKGMTMSGSFLDENLSSYMAADSSTRLPAHKYKNRANTAALLLRGKDAGTAASAHDFADPGLFPAWAVDPLLLAQHPAKFGGAQMAATLLATDQAGVAPLREMQDKAYAMLSARAYVHQYEAYGLGAADFAQAFAVVEDVLGAYAAL